MEEIFKIIGRKINQPNKNIHSEAHYWADVISRAFGEKKKFGMYLGVIKRIGLVQAKKIFAEIQDSEVTNPGKLFLWKTGPKRQIYESTKNSNNSSQKS
ncbi:MAG: hypothetical protein NTU97_00450 [Candidatus Magasanikbacteria bacterium]|nr:hypothetical protein [Candidatus Magasanikbacteria bacterium]